MNTDVLKKFCRAFCGSLETEHGHPSNILSYSVGDKKFAYFKTSTPEQWRFSIRVSPERFLELTDQPGIKPARYMHRYHWVTIINVAMMPEDYLMELVQWSYEKAFCGLSKKKQAELKSMTRPSPGN